MQVPRLTIPKGHGELLTQPPYADWADLARENARRALAWDFAVAGRSAAELRRDARLEAMRLGSEFSRRLGVPVRAGGGDADLVLVTGHQPDLYHPGIWIKVFLLQRLADETGGAALDLVVDSDGFAALEIHAPCMRPRVTRCREVLAMPTPDGYYAGAPVPSSAELARFRKAGADALATLPSPALARHFAQFCDALETARVDAANLAELVTFARRRYEAPARTRYLELPLTLESRAEPFSAFAADVALQAERFFAIYNEALQRYRRENRTRSPAQPLPDLRREGDLLELPFWHLAGAERREVWVRPGREVVLIAGGETIAILPAEPHAAVRALRGGAARLAPRAIALTLFHRLFVADLFLHGVGGARYDRVTDDVMRSFFGVEPPPFVITSLTLYLPLGAPVVSDRELEEAERHLERLTHNPDDALDDVEFAEEGQRVAAAELAAEKARLVAEVARPDADKRAIGSRIREVNRRLAELVAPYAREVEAELEELREQRQAADILTDRTYPFCFWNPEEVQDKAR